MRRISHFALAFGLASSLSILPTAAAFADNAVADGDAATAGAQNVDISVGDVCLGETKDVATPVYLVRTGNGTNVYKNGSTVSVTGSAPAGVATVAAGAGIAVPSNWDAESTRNGSLAGPSQWTLRLTAPTSAGAFARTVTFTASGVNGSDAPLSRPDAITYSGTAVSCVVAKQAQAITFGELANKTFGDPSFAVAAMTSSGLSVSFGASGACSVASSTVTVTGAGTCSITADQAGNDTYEPARPVTRSFVVAKAATVTLVSCPDASYSFSGVAQTPCSASVSGAGGLTGSPAVIHANNLHAGVASASASYAESANHLASSGSATFTIAKATTTSTVTCTGGPFTYTGQAQTPCSAEVTGPADLTQVLEVRYGNNTAAGTASASASYAGTSDYAESQGSASFGIGRASTVTTVTCEGVPSYTGAAQTPCSARVTGPGLNEELEVSYQDNINAGPASASASFAEQSNYAGSSDSEAFTIAKASTETVVTCSAGPFSYTGQAKTPCSAQVTGPGGLSESPLVTYTDNVNAGEVTASASYAGNDNYLLSQDSKIFVIDKAVTTTTLTCEAGPFVYSGSAYTPCTASVTGPGLTQNVTVTYSNNINAGTATAVATYSGTGNYFGSAASKNFSVLPWTLKGFYQPVDMGGVVNTVKGGSTVPLKFEVFKGATELTSTSVVQALAKQTTCSATGTTDDIELTVTGGTSLRYDATGGQFIFNWQTPKTIGSCYTVTATMQDGSSLTALFKTK